MGKRQKTGWPALLALLLCLGLCGCSLLGGFFSGEDAGSASEEQEPEIEPEYPVTVGGVAVESRPGKIVSLSPSLTEKLCDLKAGGRLVGVSDSCDYPPAAAALPSCGTVLLPDLEAILALSPHLVLSASELPAQATEALAAAGIPVAVFPRADSLEELWAQYEDLAALLDGGVSGAAAGAAFVADFEARLDELTRAAGEEPLPALYLRMLDFTVATGDTLENELMERIGLRNIASGYTGWQYPADAAQDSGDFAQLKIIYCDEASVDIKMLEGSAFYRTLPAVLYDWYYYIDADIFERQSLRMLDQLAGMQGAIGD